MMIKALFAVLLASGFAIFPAAASAGFYCGNKLISEGDHQARVAALCGEADHESSRTVYRSGTPRRQYLWDAPGSSYFTERELQVHRRSVVEVRVDTWVYNFGSRRLVRELIFENGRLVDERSLGHGYER